MNDRTRHPGEDRLVSKLWGWMRGRREESEAGAGTASVEAGRVRVAAEGAREPEPSPFDSPLDECATVITSAPRL